jgi:hypothetical protein
LSPWRENGFKTDERREEERNMHVGFEKRRVKKRKNK